MILLLVIDFTFGMSLGQSPKYILPLCVCMCGCVCVCVLCCFSHVQLFVTVWTVVHQDPLWESSVRNIGMGCLALLQGIFQTQGLSPCLLWLMPCRQVFYQLATTCQELTHWKRLWCWEGLGAGGEGDDRGWNGWMASLTRWTWVWVNSGSCWWTGRPGMLRFMGSQRVRHN